MIPHELVVLVEVLSRVHFSEFVKAVEKAGYTKEEVLGILNKYLIEE